MHIYFMIIITMQLFKHNTKALIEPFTIDHEYKNLITYDFTFIKIF